MTQASRPQADNRDAYPAPSDPGPYSSDMWSELFGVLYTGDQQATQGPLVRYLNELAVTDNAATEVYVATGAGMANGHFLVSSEQETWAVPAGPVGGRTDRVVMVENNSNAEVTQSIAGRPLLFPNDLSEYTATPGVPAYSARLAILRGDDLGALPALDQTNALYMVELARYDINNVPTISAQVDHRDFCEFSTEVVPAMIADRTRKFFIHAEIGRNLTDGTTIQLTWQTTTGMPVLSFPDNKQCQGVTTTTVPQDYVSGFSLVPIFYAAGVHGAGNLWCFNRIQAGGCAESFDTHDQNDGYHAIAIAGGTQTRECDTPALLSTNIIAGDIVLLRIDRDAVNVSDTWNASIDFIGWIVEYTADS